MIIHLWSVVVARFLPPAVLWDLRISGSQAQAFTACMRNVVVIRHVLIMCVRARLLSYVLAAYGTNM